MSASTYVGRIGALAAALGVGAAVLTGPAIAWADPASSDASGSSEDSAAAGSTDSATGSQSAAATTSAPKASRGQAARAARTARTAQSTAPESTPGAGQSSSDGPAEDLPAVPNRDLSPQRASVSAESSPAQKSDSSPAPAAAAATAAAAAAAKSNDDAPSAAPVAAQPADPAAAAPSGTVESAPVPAPAAAQTVTSLVETVTAAVATAPTVTVPPATPTITLPTALTNVASRISTVVNSLVTQLVNTFSNYSPFAPQLDSPANWLLLAAARRQPLAAAATAGATSATPSPTLVLDGYDVVAASTEIVETFTGRWAYWPGQPNMLQGRQDFNLVDPDTKEVLGSFSALVTSGDPTSLGARYVEMLVTANDGTNVGTGAGQTPPVGSIISEFSLGGFGFSYAAMPSPSGDKVSVKINTPFASIPIPLTYDASAGIADHTFDNKPTYLTNGYYIKPTAPAAETITGSIGFLPLFNSVQGVQEFGVYDTDGNKVGTFTGNFTTTSDTLGISTQAIQVIANDGTNVGTGAGQTPPVGTVYNVAYFWSDDNFLIYSSMPKPSGGSAIALKFSSNGKVTDLEQLPISLATFDASHEPAMKALVAPGGQKFVATSEVVPVGVNGLPPRDVQIQGYQQFDVYDFLGRKIGTVDAQVENQWDATGVHSKSILITDVTSGTAGASPLAIPPVGSVMNFVDFGTGLGFADSVIPLTPKINLNSWQLVTPIANIPLLPSPWLNTTPAVDYFDPFV